MLGCAQMARFTRTGTIPAAADFGTYNSQTAGVEILSDTFYPSGDFKNIFLTLGTRVVNVYINGILVTPTGNKIFPFNKGDSIAFSMLCGTVDGAGPIAAKITCSACFGGTTHDLTFSTTYNTSIPEGYP